MHKTWCRQSGSLEEINNTGGRQTYNFLQKIYTVTTRNPNQSVRNGSKSKPFRSEWLRIQTIPFGMARNPNHGSKSEPFRKAVRCPNVQIPDGSKSEPQNGSDGRMVRILGSGFWVPTVYSKSLVRHRYKLSPAGWVCVTAADANLYIYIYLDRL